MHDGFWYVLGEIDLSKNTCIKLCNAQISASREPKTNPEAIGFKTMLFNRTKRKLF